MIRRIGGITRRRRLVFSVSASATAAAAASAYEPPVRRRRLDLQQYAAAVAPYGSSSRLALTRPPPSSLPFAGVAPLGSHPILIRSHSSSSSSDTRPSLQRRQPLPIATTSSFSPLGPLSSSQRGLVTKAQQPPPRSSGRLHSRVVRTDGRLPLQQMQRRGFWTPRFMRQIGVPWFVQVFYGTLLMVGLGVLAFAVFSASFIFGGLFLLAFAFFRLFAQRPQLARRVMRGPAHMPPGAFFRPFFDMVSEGVMMDGLRNARGAIERDVLACLNRHPRLRSYGQDFKATGLTNMSMESVNVNGLARQHVVMEMLVVSSKPRELFIRVSASHHPEEDGGQGEGRWEYESVEARTPDGNVVDLTQDVTRGGRKIVVIDVDPREVREGD